MVGRALRSGQLVRINLCEQCGIQTKTQGHHHKGYDVEHVLDLQWLCAQCHSIAHCTPELMKVIHEFPELWGSSTRSLKLRSRQEKHVPQKRQLAKRPRGHEHCGQNCLLRLIPSNG
jgi:hypothetical protein